MRDRLVDDGPDEIVGAEEEGDLRELGPDLDPVRLDVVHVVEQQARNRDDAQIELAGRGRQVGERRVLGMEGERDDAGDPAGLVLEVAQAQQVVDALLGRLDVSVEHRRVGPHARPVALRARPRASARPRSCSCR